MLLSESVLRLTKKAFWDIDLDKIDVTEKANFIIRRVFERGDLDDLTEVLAFYNENIIKDALVTAPYLNEYTLSFASQITNTPKENFECYKNKLSRLSAWPL